MFARLVLVRSLTILALAIATVSWFALLTHPRPCHRAAAAQADTPPPRSAGVVLVATEAMPDPTFVGTRILLLHHDAQGAVGVITNHPVDESADHRLTAGGPVEPDTVIVLHSDDWRAAETQTVCDGVRSTPARAVMAASHRGEGPARSLIYLGYAGWGPGQLQAELDEGVWRVESALPGEGL